ncbi:MAG TPA: outer membrane protein transport protein [Thermoguttaceae bacterium]|nr:outer membrane protein transport protein [Thermoguttaceae bacterium]
MKCFPTSRALCQVCVFSSLLVLPFISAGAAIAQGVALNGVGPINRSMGGASTAAPIDAAGALHWNPASISGLASSEIGFGLELLLPTEELSSQVAANAFGAGVPPVNLSGSTQGEPGVSPIPSAAWVHKCENSPWTYGLGMYGIAGFRVNYPGSDTNPVLMSQANGGLGHVVAEAEFLQVVPTISYAISPKLSFGVAPTITLAKVAVDPLLIGPQAGGAYTSGNGTRQHWGGGVQLGLYYVGDHDWHFGASIKSPQWFEDFRFRTEDGDGGTRTVTFDLDYPMIISFGTAYSGFDRWLFACDLRYFDYKNTAGFGGGAGFGPGGEVTGLGWNNLFSLSTGVQYRPTDSTSWRLGYTFQQSPSSDHDTFFNIPAPLNIQHLLAFGASHKITKNVILSAAYIHGFESQSTGPYHIPGLGPVAGTSATSKISADALTFGVKLLY